MNACFPAACLSTVWCGVLLWALALCAGVGAEPRRVLLVHSYGREFAPYDTFSGHFRTELAKQSVGPVDFYEVSLESARFPVTTPVEPFLEYVMALFEGRRLDLVVPIGGPAARFAQQHRAQLFPGTPVLLAAVDQRHLDDSFVTSRDAVVAVKNDPRRILAAILELLPKTTNVAVVIGSSPLEQFWLGQLRREFEPYSGRVAFDWLNGLSLAEMRAHCGGLPPQSAIFFALLSVDGDGVPHLEQRALSELHDAANAPIFGLHDTQLGHGIVGGPLMAISDLSQTTAGVAVRILAGAPPDTMRIPPMEPGSPQFDWRELQRWGIEETRLPPGSTISFRPPTLWETNKKRFITITAVGLVEAVLIILLLANLMERRRAERALRESKERFRVAVSAGEIGVWIWDLEDNTLWASDSWRRMYGFSADAALRYEHVIQRIQANDRPGEESAVQRAVQDRTDYTGEYRVQLPDGTQRWIAARGRLDADSVGHHKRMLGASVDISERKRVEEAARDLSGRLLRAQEEERARLGRELHDDITQRLARLAIDVGLCEQGTSTLSPAETAREVREGLVRLSEDVHALSYRLHPSLLEELGLADALKAECERFSRQHSIPVEIKLRELPASLSAEVALALFRVAQEALRNVARHARATGVEVSVWPMDDGLHLAVRDDGVGFDAALKPEHCSLGLASMRERTRLLGGTLDIQSGHGLGTTVLAWVPWGIA